MTATETYTGPELQSLPYDHIATVADGEPDYPGVTFHRHPTGAWYGLQQGRTVVLSSLQLAKYGLVGVGPDPAVKP